MSSNSSSIRTARLAVICAGLIAASMAQAEPPAPTVGVLRNTSEANALTYECAKSNGLLNCSFIQTRIVRVLLPKDAAKQGKETRDLLEGPMKDRMNGLANDGADGANELCGMFAQIPEILAGSKSAPPKLVQIFRSKSEFARTKILNDSNRTLALCNAKSDKSLEQALNSYANYSTDQLLKSCKVSAITFKQSFSLHQSDKNLTVWGVIDSATGPCGIVRLDRFEAETSKGFPIWTYFSRKAVTNPSGTSPLIGSCKQFDEAEYKFDEEEQPVHGCEILDFRSAYSR